MRSGPPIPLKRGQRRFASSVSFQNRRSLPSSRYGCRSVSTSCSEYREPSELPSLATRLRKRIGSSWFSGWRRCVGWNSERCGVSCRSRMPDVRSAVRAPALCFSGVQAARRPIALCELRNVYCLLGPSTRCFKHWFMVTGALRRAGARRLDTAADHAYGAMCSVAALIMRAHELGAYGAAGSVMKEPSTWPIVRNMDDRGGYTNGSSFEGCSIPSLQVPGWSGRHPPWSSRP